MGKGDESQGIISLNPKIIGAWIGIVIPLYGSFAFLWDYDKNLVKKSDIIDHEQFERKDVASVRDLEARIERTEILIAVFSRDSGSLSETEKNDYESAKARLINLQNQRDELIRPQ